MKNMKKGFTLVEVLIVVVIIAILASLIVPRMLLQTDKAKAAEALQIVGAIKRAADRYYDFSASSQYDTNDIVGGGGATALLNFSELGLNGIEKSTSYRYEYLGATGNYTIYASPSTAPVRAGAPLTVNSAGTWTCSSPFANTTTVGQGCTV